MDLWHLEYLLVYQHYVFSSWPEEHRHNSISILCINHYTQSVCLIEVFILSIHII